MARTARAGSNGISRGLTKRLYAPIFLLDILNDNLVDNDEGPSLNLHHASSQGSKEIFECFVNKLGQFCDVKKGGDTVTSVVILQDDTGVEYCFTSNQRTRSSFEASKRFLSDHILGVLGSTPDDHLDDTDRMSRVCSGMLRKVLAHSRWRIKAYIATLAQHIGFCIDICNGESAREATISYDLRSFQRLSAAALSEWQDPVSFADKSCDLLQAISDRWNQGLDKFLRQRAAVNPRERDITQWGHVRHAIGRLQSYSIAMQVLVEARRRWPVLFRDFRVEHVPSAPKERNWMEMKEDRCTGEKLLRCVRADRPTMDAYQALDHNLLGDIDSGVHARIRDPEFRTLIHAEVHLVDYLTSQRGSARFFGEDDFGRYVGCSKPTCLLCDMFLQEHPLDVRWRRSHRNLYTNWRVPDNTDRLLVEGIAGKLRGLIGRTILSRAASRRRYDSSHNPSDPFRYARAMAEHGSTAGDNAGRQNRDEDEESEFAWEEHVDNEEILMSQLDRLQLGSREPLVPNTTLDTGRVYEVDESDDDGGATL